MYTPNHNRFRRDLVIVAALSRSQDPEQLVWIKDPRTGKLFSLKPEEYFLCLAMDGVATLHAIADAFFNHFQRSVSLQVVRAFSKQVYGLGLMEPCPGGQGDTSAAPVLEDVCVGDRAKTTTGLSEVFPESNYTQAPLKPPVVGNRSISQRRSPSQLPGLSIWLWSTKKPNVFLAGLARLLLPFRRFLSLIKLSLIVLFPIALFTLARHHVMLWHDVKLYINGPLPNLFMLLEMTGLQGSLAKLASGVVASTYGNAVQRLGFGLLLGIMPRCLLSLSDRRMTRQQKVHVYGAPILVRLAFFTWATFFWFNSFGRDTALRPLALVIMISSLFGLLIDAIPLWPSDGYDFLIAQLGLSNLFGRSFQIWSMVLNNQSFPRSLSRKERLGLQAMGVIGALSLMVIVFFVIFFLSSGLVADFAARILGNAASVALFSGMTAIFVYKLFGVWSMMRTGNDRPLPPHGQSDESLQGLTRPEPSKVNFAWLKTRNRSFFIQVGFAFATLIFMLIPYQFRPGGQILVLPQKEQKIQAPLAGKVVKVFSQDQDEMLISAGTPIAILESRDLNNSSRDIEDQIAVQLSTIAGKESELGKARQQFKTYTQQAEYSASKYKRQAELREQGAISVQAVEEAARQKETDKSNALTQSKVIETASFDVDQAKAVLVRLRNQKLHLRSEVQLTTLRMPFDGYIVTTQLIRKVGTYLNQGDTFATTKVADSNFMGEVLVPESETDQVMLGRDVEIKLFAFPQHPIQGRVVSVGPVAVTSDTSGTVSTVEDSGQDIRVVEQAAGKVVKTIVMIKADPGVLIRAGMTGRAKIDGKTMPLILVFSRSLVRFISVEMWSWLP